MRTPDNDPKHRLAADGSILVRMARLSAPHHGNPAIWGKLDGQPFNKALIAARLACAQARIAFAGTDHDAALMAFWRAGAAIQKLTMTVPASVQKRNANQPGAGVRATIVAALKKHGPGEKADWFLDKIAREEKWTVRKGCCCSAAGQKLFTVSSWPNLVSAAKKSLGK